MTIHAVARWFMVERDLELLARWLPVIEGRAASLEPVTRGGAVDKGRGDLIDDRHCDLRRALVIHGRLCRLRALPEGELHLAVLRFVFLESGEVWRRRADPLLDGGGIAEVVGRRFAEPVVAARWATLPQRALRRALPRKYGQGLLDAATEAYARAVAKDAQTEPERARAQAS